MALDELGMAGTGFACRDAIYFAAFSGQQLSSQGPYMPLSPVDA